MLGWSILMVSALLIGAAVLAALAARLRLEVDRVDATLDAFATLATVELDLADEVARTEARRTGRTAPPVAADGGPGSRSAAARRNPAGRAAGESAGRSLPGRIRR